MSASKELTVLAAGFLAGDYTEDTLLEILGDESLVTSVIAMSGGLIGAGIVAQTTKHVIDNDVLDPIFDTADDIIDSGLDVLSDLNPFSW